MHVVRMSGAVFSYPGGVNVLDQVSLTLEPGCTVAIVGPSGSGKSTLLQVVGGHLRPRQGTVERPSPDGIGHIFQVPTILRRRSVWDNVALGTLGSFEGEGPRREEVERSLHTVGLLDLKDRDAGSLSGGEIQRVQIARAFASRPALVIADEPTGQLDARNAGLIGSAFRSISAGTSTAVLIATHDLLLATSCDRSYQLRAGDLVEESHEE